MKLLSLQGSGKALTEQSTLTPSLRDSALAESWQSISLESTNAAQEIC